MPTLLLLLVFQEEPGIRLAKEFKATLVSDHALANDVYSMTLDARGRIVVSSQGWVKSLHDDDGDGRADRAELFAALPSGAMGMSFDGNDLLVSSAGGLHRLRDADGDGRADGPPEKIAPFGYGEHGHHAMRKGPDGSWYLIVGNDAGVSTAHVSHPRSPVRQPQTGAVLRYAPDFSASEVVAHGFRNPYDFDFNARGDLFTYDSDCERDYFLPWYTPTRVYQVAVGVHHGWRLTGYQRSYARRDTAADTVGMLVPVGRGSPTGVVCYRHGRFPERFRGGLFYADWTFGKVYFTPLDPRGAGYAAKQEVFLEPAGSDGFAPTDLCVAPDGTLLVSIGGRRTRGAVYRIDAVTPSRAASPGDELETVLSAPQPLDAWSRARWEPLARKLGGAAFDAAWVDPSRPVAARLRAIEVLTELFPKDRKSFAMAVQDPDPAVRARTAWSIERVPAGEDLLPALARDPDAGVRVAALQAMSAPDAAVLLANLGHAEKRVRHAAARLAGRMDDASFLALEGRAREAGPAALAGWTLAALWSARGADARVVEACLEVLKRAEDPELRHQGVRLLILALGDANLKAPPAEVFSNYSLETPPGPEGRDLILSALRPLFPSGHELLDLELSRLLAMLEDAQSVEKTAAFLTETSTATADVHYLIVLARLKGAWPQGLASRTAHALLSTGRKLEGQEQRTKQTWGARLSELAEAFSKREPAFARALLAHPAFVAPAHVEIAAVLPEDVRRAAAWKFLEAARDPAFGWSERLISLLSSLPRDVFVPALRAQASNLGLRDSVVLRLAAEPEAQDRALFAASVESANAQVVRASLGALGKLPPDGSPKLQVPLLRLFRRLLQDPKQAELRSQVLAQIARDQGRTIASAEGDPASLARAHAPLFEDFVRRNPSLKADLDGGGEDPAALRERLRSVPWAEGDVKRGAELFRLRGCQTCHAVQGALGPNLSGAAKRFSREDLFEALANPGKDVAPLYRTTVFLTKDGQVHTGIVAFESADGYIVQTGATTTVRIATSDIAGMKPGTLSIMPNGLLEGLKASDLADLDAYLRSIP